MLSDDGKTKEELLEELESARLKIAEQAKDLGAMKSFSGEMENLGMVGRWELDIRTSKLWWSEGVYAMFEVNPEEFGASYESYLDAIHPEDREKVNQAYFKSLETKSPYNIEYRLLFPDGRVKWVRQSCRTDHGSAGNPLRVIGTVHDLTESKLARVRRDQERASTNSDETNEVVRLRESLMKSEARLSAALEAIEEGFVIYDSEDRLAVCNAKYLEIYKESADLLVPGNKFEDIVRAGVERGQYPEAAGREEAWIADRMVAHRAGNTTIEQKLPNGRWLKIAERKAQDGSLVGFRVDISELKRIEEALRSSEEKFRLLAERMTDVIWTMDLNFKNTYVTPSVERVVGFAVEERMEQTLEEMVTPESLVKVQKTLGRALAIDGEGRNPNRSVMMDLEFYRKDGSTIWTENVVSFIRNAAGEIIGLQGVSRDITERKQAQKILERSEERYRSFMANSLSGVWWYEVEPPMPIDLPAEAQVEWLSHNAFLAECSAEYARAYGFSEPSEMFGRPFLDFLGGNEEIAREIILQLIEQGYTFPSSETRVVSHIGEEVWLIISGAGLIEDGRLIRVWGTQLDVTKHKRVMNEIRQKTEEFSKLISALPDAVVRTDMEAKATYVSPHTLDLFAIGDESQVLGSNILQWVHPDFHALATSRIGAAITGEAAGTATELMCCRLDGTTFWASVKSSLLEDGDGKAAGLILVISDITERKQADKAIKESQERVRAIVESINTGIIIIDRQDHTIVEVNPFAAEIIGKTREEIIGHKCHKFVCPKMENDCPITDHKQAIDNEERFILTADGKQIPVLKTVVPINFGGVDCLLESFVDITERKKAEEERIANQRQMEAMSKSEAYIRTLFDLLPDPVVVYDMEDKAVIINTAFEKTFGWSRQELLNQRIDFVPNEALPETIVILEQIKQGGRVKGFGTKRLTKGGRTLSVVLNTAPYFEDGRQTGNIMALRDISELTAAEKALRKSETRYQNLVENLPEGIVTITADRIITYVNQPLATMLGYSLEELIGQDLTLFYDKEGQAILEREWAQRRQGGREPYQTTMAKKDGGRAFVMIYPRPLFSEYGHFQGVTALVTNITQLKILESQLLQAQKLESIGQLAAGIAHEINTPTQYVADNTRFLRDSLLGMLKLLELYGHLHEQTRGSEQFAEVIAQINEISEDIDLEYLIQEIPLSLEQTLEGLEHIAKIVRSMKEFAHPGPDTKTAVDLNKAIESTITVSKNEWKYVADVETDFDPDLPAVPCIPGEINQVFLNIIVNAAHAIGDMVEEDSSQKGTIRISTRRVEGQAEIRIADNGPGIPAGIRDRVFDPFFTTKEVGKGTGQGLAIAHSVIADKHKGTLSFVTEEGKGTTFIILLPSNGEA